MRTACRASLVVILVIARSVYAADPPALTYTSQDSANTKWHSGIYVEGSKFIWDTQFANLVNASFGTKPNEAGFAFMQCRGGGMIDELVPLNLNNVSFTSASRHDQMSYAGERDTEVFPGTFQSYYNQRWSPVAGTATVNTLKEAAIQGRKLDIAGPFEDKQEDPHYTSSGAAGDSVKLHRNNSELTMQSDRYRAILFGGFEEKKAEQILGNFNSLVRVHADLLARGFTETEMYIMYQGGKNGKAPDGSALPTWIDDDATAAAMKRAFTDYKNSATAKTQFLYWSGPNHGGRSNDEKAMRSNAAALSGTTYPYDTDPAWIDELKNVYDVFASEPVDGQSVRVPYYSMTATENIPDLTLTLNGMPLSTFSISDLWGDGSEWQYKFLLTQSDLNMLSASNDIRYDWTSGSSQLDVLIGGLVDGDSPNSIPEPAAISAAVLVFALGTRTRRRSAHCQTWSFQ
jgi:hypothetical protein